jgi:hypothetical protein
MQPGPQPGPQFGAPAPQRRSRGRALLTHGLVAVVALAIGVGAGGSKGSAATTTAAPAPAPTVTVTVTAKAAAPRSSSGAVSGGTPTTGAATTVAGDGEYLVGQDMQPGTYRTAGPADGSGGDCYWQRSKDSSGSMDSIIANDNLAGSGRVTVSKGEVFKSTGCQNWVKTG